MLIFFTDLDGTLLDNDSYSWKPARPALDRIRELGVPLVFVTSKTRAEVEHWRSLLANTDPFVMENGGAAFIPGRPPLTWGTPYPNLCEALRGIARRTGYQLCGFHQMKVPEIARATGLTPDDAARAARREYDEPFLIQGPYNPATLRAAIEDAGLRYTQGGRFHHLHGDNDKGVAVSALLDYYRGIYGPVVSAGLGDAANDLEFLKLMNHAHFSQEGPAGWNRFVLDLLAAVYHEDRWTPLSTPSARST